MGNKVRQFVGNIKGPKGDTFTPSVDSELNLSWSNDGGLPNPEAVSLKPPLASDSGDGLMSAADKAKLDGSNRFTDADVLTLETAGEKSNAAFSAIDDLLTGLQVPVYKRFISNGAFRLNAPNGGRMDEFRVAASMAGQTVHVALITDFFMGRDSEGGQSRIITDNPKIKTATVGADGSLNVTFNSIPHDCIIVVTSTDIASHYANGNHDDVRYAKVLFTCRYTRNTGVFMGLSDIPAVSMSDFADKLGYSIRYARITDMAPEAVATTTSDAVFLYSGEEYYELAGTKPSEIPNQNAVYYRCLYQRKEL